MSMAAIRGNSRRILHGCQWAGVTFLLLAVPPGTARLAKLVLAATVKN